MSLKKYSIFYVFSIVLFVNFPSQAQISPEPPPEPQPLPERKLPTLETPLDRTPDPFPKTLPDGLTIKEFEFEGNTVFSDRELIEITSEYLNRPLSLKELNDATNKITQLYFDRGYINSGAFILRQKIADGKITIKVVEGSIQQINVAGLNRLSPGYVRSRIAKGAKTPFNQDRLLRSLELLQLDPLIEDISAKLTPGDEPGVSILNIKTIEADPFTLQLTLDNQRSSIVGSFRRKFDIDHLNFFGFGDRFTVGYVNTDGSNSLDNLSYTIPLNASNGTISVRHSRTASDLINLPAFLDPLDLTSDTIDYDFSFRQPLYRTLNQEFSIGATVSHSFNQTLGLIDGEGSFPITVEANDRGEIRISTLRLFQEYVNRDRRQVFAALSEFNIGLDAFNSTIDRNPQFNLADSKFFSWRGQTQYLRLLNENPPYTTLLLKGELQIANDLLLPREQFILGGVDSVRGHPKNALFGDNGLLLSAEVRQPILSIDKWDLDLQVAPFIDFGKVWSDPISEQIIPQNSLFSVGVGLILNVGRNFDARLDWGIPFQDLGNEKNNLQQNGVYFQIQFRPW